MLSQMYAAKRMVRRIVRAWKDTDEAAETASISVNPSPPAAGDDTPHFVRDYESFVTTLLANFPRDEAMSHAVGGAYEQTGQTERAILEYAGLRQGMSLVFTNTIEQQRTGNMPHLNMFIERSVIGIWCQHLGFELLQIVEGAEAPWGGRPLGQCTAILRKPR